MKTSVYSMDEKSGVIIIVADYSIEPKKALIAYVMQQQGDWNTWTYPDHIEGIRESAKAKNHYYYDDLANNRILAAYPNK